MVSDSVVSKSTLGHTKGGVWKSSFRRAGLICNYKRMQIYTISSASSGGNGSKVPLFAGNTDDLFGGKRVVFPRENKRVLVWPSAMFLGPKPTPGMSAQLCIGGQAWSCQGMKGRNGLSLMGLQMEHVTEQQCWSLRKAAGGKRADLCFYGK